MTSSLIIVDDLNDDAYTPAQRAKCVSLFSSKPLSSPSYCPAPIFAASSRKETAAQAAGRRFEDKALRFLASWAVGHGYSCISKPWIKYLDAAGALKFCQPDCLLISERDDNLILIEVKVRHTRDAAVQLARYKRLVAQIHPKFVISCLEFCRYFDGSEANFPLLPEVRPHLFALAAVVWEPSDWHLTLN